jgi:hypothetical protein
MFGQHIRLCLSISSGSGVNTHCRLQVPHSRQLLRWRCPLWLLDQCRANENSDTTEGCVLLDAEAYMNR